MLISATGQKILKILHLLAVSFWAGGALANLCLTYASSHAQSSDELFGILKSILYVNMAVTVYLGAFGSFFTGLAYSICTNRGFVRHKWVVLKWLITCYMILSGSLVVGPWGTELFETAASMGVRALENPAFQSIQTKRIIMGSLNMLLFLIAFVISVFKPWERAEVAARYSHILKR